MECTNRKICHGCWNRRNEFPGLDLDGAYMVNIFPICVSLPVQLGKIGYKIKEPCIGFGTMLLYLNT